MEKKNISDKYLVFVGNLPKNSLARREFENPQKFENFKFPRVFKFPSGYGNLWANSLRKSKYLLRIIVQIISYFGR